MLTAPVTQTITKKKIFFVSHCIGERSRTYQGGGLLHIHFFYFFCVTLYRGEVSNLSVRRMAPHFEDVRVTFSDLNASSCGRVLRLTKKKKTLVSRFQDLNAFSCG